MIYDRCVFDVSWNETKLGFAEFHILSLNVGELVQNYLLYTLAKPMFTRCLNCCAPFGQHGVGCLVSIASNRDNMAQLGLPDVFNLDIFGHSAYGSRYMCSPSVDGFLNFNTLKHEQLSRCDDWTCVSPHFHLFLVFASVTWWRTKDGRYRVRNQKTSRICNWGGLACRPCVMCVDMFLCVLFCETACFKTLAKRTT